MALRKLLSEKPQTPYFKPPALPIAVLKLIDQPKVVTWQFDESGARPATIKNNKLAVISDGDSLARVTVYEEFAEKLKAGSYYVMRGHNLRGQAPPFHINITSRTQFFRGSEVTVCEELLNQVDDVLDPPAPLTHLRSCTDVKGLISVEGNVVEVSAVKKVLSGREHIPVRNMRLQQDQVTVNICLWREASVSSDISLGEVLTLTHMKVSSTSYGVQLQSSSLTKVEKKKMDFSEVTIIGVDEVSGRPGTLHLLLEAEDTCLEIEEKLWRPFDEELQKHPVKVEIKVEGKMISEIKRV